jgi:hypothetical protein
MNRQSTKSKREQGGNALGNHGRILSGRSDVDLMGNRV